MMESLEINAVSELPQSNLSESAESIAEAQRGNFGISTQDQIRWADAYEALMRWREALEQKRVFVFQAAFPRDEAQGFSLSNLHPWSIVLTSDDPATARCFTLFHELGHLILRQGGVCLTEEAFADEQQTNGTVVQTTVEQWCHRFAESFLVNKRALLERRETETVSSANAGYELALRQLASAFKVSQYVILFRLFHLDIIPEPRLWDEYERVRLEAQADAARQKKPTGGPSPAVRAVQERGRLFTRLVLEGLDQEVLSPTEAIDFMGIRLKHFGRIRELA